MVAASCRKLEAGRREDGEEEEEEKEAAAGVAVCRTLADGHAELNGCLGRRDGAGAVRNGAGKKEKECRVRGSRLAAGEVAAMAVGWDLLQWPLEEKWLP
ncbi:hypothetical protein MRB53_028336 [Persea americana]|uniref:Uncharacterized protein n=1 Tax=Persea americana TaxID=3435 RepID=A0ACC2KFL3_PERAE|nr:hypothetical protein MRB53_028336 [Persea americana]